MTEKRKGQCGFFSSDAEKSDLEDSTVRRKVDEIALEEKDYDVFISLLKAYSDEPEKYVFLVEKGVIPDSDVLLPDTITYDMFVILSEAKPRGKTLQLGTFNPVLPETPWYNFYLPESKPVIYLYPEKSTKVSVKINPKDGYVTVSDPLYNPENGWQDLWVSPESKIFYQGKTYPYLYYETMIAGYRIPENGFVVKKENLAPFLRNYIQRLGLRDQEVKDFVEYWRIKLSKVDKQYIFITFFNQEEIERIDPLIIEPKPVTEIRVRAYFRPLDYLYSVEEPKMPLVPKREGFTVVEWGGILDDK